MKPFPYGFKRDPGKQQRPPWDGPNMVKVAQRDPRNSRGSGKASPSPATVRQ
jgi:hypothetical protein